MKKIVSIVAVAAVLASSVFAADVSAKVKLDGSLLNYNGNDVSAMKIGHNTDESWNPVISMSTSGDVAGASVSYYSGAWSGNTKASLKAEYSLDGGKTWKEYDEKEAKFTISQGGLMGGWNNGYLLGAKSWNIWCKPTDALKLDFGSISTNLNQEQIDWSNTDSGCDSQGYAANVSFGAANVGVYLLPGFDNFWFANKTAGETYIKFSTGGISAMFDGKNNFKDDKFGIGYNGNFGGVNAFINVLGYLNNGFNKVRAEIFAKGAAGSAGWAIWLPVDFTVADSKVAVGTIAKVNMPVGNVNAFLYIKNTNWLADSFGMTVKPGVTGSVGAMGWEIDAVMNIGGTFTLDVPVSLTVNF